MISKADEFLEGSWKVPRAFLEGSWRVPGHSLVFWRGSKEGPKKGTLSGIRKSEIWLLYLLHFSKIRNLRKGHFGGTILESIWGTKS